MAFPVYKDFLTLAEGHDLVPVWQDLPGDMDTPISLYQKMHPLGACYLLESIEGGEKLARYSFIGIDPMITIKAKNQQITVTREGQTEEVVAEPVSYIREVTQQFKTPVSPVLPRFFGGFVGYIAYDSIKYLEEVTLSAQDDLNLPDCYFVLTRIVLVYDHVLGAVKIVVLTEPHKSGPEVAYQSAVATLEKIVKLVNHPPERLPYPDIQAEPDTFRSNISKEQFLANVETAKEYIRAGDIFQVVLSQRFETRLSCSPFEVYRNLRRINPSPYMFFLNFPECRIAGASPEMLVRAENGCVQTHPIAGTRKRGITPEIDRDLANELMKDEKECAEHLMLVDLGRNDLGRVSKPGTVKVSKFSQVERFSHVMHLVSVVEGELADHKDSFDALKACFPAGTVSGAPKVRAMEIIDELEPNQRGIYAGAVTYVGLNGNMDSCIAIRTIVITDDKAFVQAGAGIVADSDPEKEYQETINKAKALMEAVHGREVRKNVVGIG